MGKEAIRVLDYNGLEYLIGKIKGELEKEVETETLSGNATVTIPSLTHEKYYIITDATSITVSSIEQTMDVCFFQFTCGDTAATLSLPASILWSNAEAPTIEANRTYQITIVNNCAVYVAFGTAS